MYESRQFASIRLKPYFERLKNTFETLQRDSYRCHLDIPTDLDLNLETLLPLGIICAELLTNSFKYGQQPERELEIQLTLRQMENGSYHFSYQDNGLGYPATFFERQEEGLGKLLIKSMVRQLMGDSRFANLPATEGGGAHFSLQFERKTTSQV